MKKAKFLQDAKQDPERFYRNPFDVIRDRRLTHEDRVAILSAWERIAEDSPAEDQGHAEWLKELRRIRQEAEQGLETAGAAPHS